MFIGAKSFQLIRHNLLQDAIKNWEHNNFVLNSNADTHNLISMSGNTQI